MIQSGSYLNIIDNSGAKIAGCIKVLGGYRKRYAKIGDLVMVSIKELRSKRRLNAKVKKGEVYKAIVVRTKKSNNFFLGDNLHFLENAIILVNKQNKFIGTRVFGSIPKLFRITRYLKLIFLASGSVS